MPISALTTFGGSLVMLASWFIVSRRMAAKPEAVTVQMRYLRNFFLNMGIFCLIMALPIPAIHYNPEAFPILMSWGYVIGHIFTYIAFMYVLRLMFSLTPRLANKDLLAVIVGVTANVFITSANFLTMIMGTHPNYNPTDKLIMYNTAPIVGVSIAVFAAVAVLPTAILMIVNGFQKPNARVRSFMLGGGLFVIMAAGPLHDVARTATVYAIADVVSVIGLLIIAFGMMYRFDERTAWTDSDAAAPAGKVGSTSSHISLQG